MLTRDEAQKLAQKVIALSTFPECQVTITASEQAYTRFANNGITTASLNLRHTVAIAVARDGKAGVMTVNDLDDASLRAAVKRPRNSPRLRRPIPSDCRRSARRSIRRSAISTNAPPTRARPR